MLEVDNLDTDLGAYFTLFFIMAMVGNLLENRVDQWFLLSMVIRVYWIDGQIFVIFVRILEILLIQLMARCFYNLLGKKHQFDPKLNNCQKQNFRIKPSVHKYKSQCPYKKKMVKDNDYFL